MRTRGTVRAAVLGAGVALVVGVSAIPASTQTEPVPTGTTVAAVTGSASGVFVGLQEEVDEPFGSLEPLIEAARGGDADAVATALATLGVDAGSDVGAQVVETTTVGPIPAVALPATGGGPFTDSVPNVDLVGDSFTDEISGAATVSTEGALGTTGFARSAATVADYNLPMEFEELLFVADAVEVEWRSDLPGGPVGATRFVDADTFDGPMEELPAPNTVLVDEVIEIPQQDQVVRLFFRLVVNEQTVGVNDISVVGARSFFRAEVDPLIEPPVLLEQVDATVGEVSCGVVPGAVLEPTFTG